MTFHCRLLVAAVILVIASPARATQAPPLEPNSVLPAVISDVRISGLWRTKPYVVRRELPWKPGDEVSLDDWKLGLTHLWNMGVFSRVSATLVRENGKLVAKIDLEERWTINVIFRFGSGGGVNWWDLGLSDINTFGRYLETGAFYQRFGDFNGGEAWLHDPRFLGARQDLYFTLDRLTRPRSGRFVQVRSGAQLQYSRQISETLSLGGSGEVDDDRFSKAQDGPAELPVNSEMASLGGLVLLGRVDTLRLREVGQSLEIRPSVAITTDPAHPVFGALWLQAFLFRVAGERFNLAVRAQAGAMTPAPPQSEYFIGGLDLVRGLVDGAIQTRLFALANVEARFVAFDSTWLGILPTAFVDGVVARLDDGRQAAAMSVGGGVRLIIPRFVRSGLRLDAALPLGNAPAGPWYNVGVWEFF